ncbi:MAG: sugar phosphate isomerase/epimerase [Candidatus Sumerlaeia bacterium]|nr:sugar phosphate isomerase/epimerase [Candidatus Sumerlaeia bacterium]
MGEKCDGHDRRRSASNLSQAARDNGLGFSAVGSPIGKFPLNGDFNEELDRLKKAIEFCHILGCRYIRIFSYYIPEGHTHEEHRGQVMDWLGRLVAEAEKTDVILCHENERLIYGDKGRYCLDIHQTLQSPHLRGVFDFANYIHCEEDPLENWPALKPYVEYFHVKDSRRSDLQMVPAGQGDGRILEILTDAARSGFDNFLTLEPHLSVAEKNWGRTTPDLFKTATDALRSVMAAAGMV